MKIVLNSETVKKIGHKPLKDFGVSEDTIKWDRTLTIDLSDLTRTKTETLRVLLKNYESLPGIPARIGEIESWQEVLSGKDKPVKKLANLPSMMKQYLKDKPQHWLYQKLDGLEVWQPYYVEEVTYHPERRHDGWTDPAYVNVDLWWEEFGKVNRSTDTYHSWEVLNKTVPQILADAGYLVESPSMLMAHRRMMDRYAFLFKKIGHQVLGTGIGKEVDREDRYWYSFSNIRLDRDDGPSRMVIDVLNESDKEDNGKDKRPSTKFWDDDACEYEGDEGDNDKDLKPGDEDEIEKLAADIPVRPSVVVFDLKRHKRLSVHVAQLTDYKYDVKLADKLILPDEVRSLVDMLVSHKGGFKDIIGNKGNSSIILCAGIPGTGKSLTAEVYSEAMSRPLYSIQCSQLGLTPDKLEQQLLKVFSRAARWGAILLIDEADVYVAARGSNLEQNAIVGVFLRVLEYYQGVMFMTTNRADLVDDAIASRCLAKIEYTAPSPENQKRIWRVLSDSSGVAIKDSEIDKVVKKYPKLSGRDCKNLLKLASMVAEASGKPVDAKTIESVKAFKPTADAEK